MNKRIACICVLAAGSVAFAQKEWEFGAVGGYGFAPNLKVEGRSGSANTGLRPGLTIGAFGGNDMYNRWSGEVRYIFRYSDLKLSSGGTTARFDAHQHVVHADFLGHFADRESRLRPFVAFGAGVRVLVGTGIESASQPNARFAALTNTHEVLPVADVGIGAKYNLSDRLRLRFEVRDYISPPPSNVIAPVPGNSVSRWLNDFVGTVGLSYYW
jgi:hypothetical protein